MARQERPTANLSNLSHSLTYTTKPSLPYRASVSPRNLPSSFPSSSYNRPMISHTRDRIASGMISNRQAWRGKCRLPSGRPSGWPRRRGRGSGRRGGTVVGNASVRENVLWFLWCCPFLCARRGEVASEAWRSGEVFLVVCCSRALGNSDALAFGNLYARALAYSATRRLLYSWPRKLVTSFTRWRSGTSWKPSLEQLGLRNVPDGRA
jgi:hypothetical protein